jgi:hypothetical protein
MVGEQLLRFAESDPSSGHELSINGQTVHVTSAHTSLSLGAVLDRFQELCETHADGMVKDLGDLEPSLGRAPTIEGFPGIGILRDERDGRGVIACFAAGGAVDTSLLGARLQRFTTSYDFAELGDLRYVAARTLESGSTEVVATWTEGHFRLGEMFPTEGEATGEDPRFAPRPAGGRRILSARDVRAPYGVFLYQVSGERSAALSGYARTAAMAGFTEHRAVSERDADSAAFERPGVDVLVNVSTTDDGLSLLSIVEMPAGAGGKERR